MPLNPLSFNILVNVIRENELPNISRVGRKRKIDIAYVLERIMYVLESGCQWSHLEVRNGSWKTVYHYFNKWSGTHLFQKAYGHILALYHKDRGIGDKLLLDTSFIKNIFGRDCVGPSPFDRGRKATKVSALVDGYGTPLAFTFHPGNKNDSRTLQHTLSKSPISLHNKELYADKIYDSAHCRNILQSYHMVNKVSKKRTKGVPPDNRIRIVVEHTFSWLDKFRRILVRYESKVSSLRSFHYLAACQITGRRCVTT